MKLTEQEREIGRQLYNIDFSQIKREKQRRREQALDPMTNHFPTSGQETPEIPVRLIDSSPRADLLAALQAVAIDKGLLVKMDSHDCGRANGFFRPDTRTIEIAAGLPDAQQVKTLAHELAHSILHGQTYDYHANRPDAELQAESVAYLVCGSQGMDSAAYSFGYVASWATEQGNLDKTEVADRLLKSTKAIRAASEDLVTAVEAKLVAPAEPVSASQWLATAYSPKKSQLSSLTPGT
ncbi:MAG: ImmA/IrrE family metallo-endopeptidase [Candidatus Dormibacteraeota bacterium]|nr:ImmA/IrrE family metallo-endopeptidase [Candidatus Dormibacteraeota bacterium]